MLEEILLECETLHDTSDEDSGGSESDPCEVRLEHNLIILDNWLLG